MVIDSVRFDHLVRAATRGRSRRDVLRGLIGTMLAGTVAGGVSEEAAARCPRRRRCGKGNCCPKGEVCGDKTTKTCVTKQGTCSAGTNACISGQSAATECTSSATSTSTATCYCFRTQKGETRCGIPEQNFCSSCHLSTDPDAACRAAFSSAPYPLFCAKGTGGEGCVDCPDGAYCVRPCKAF